MKKNHGINVLGRIVLLAVGVAITFIVVYTEDFPKIFAYIGGLIAGLGIYLIRASRTRKKKTDTIVVEVYLDMRDDGYCGIANFDTSTRMLSRRSERHGYRFLATIEDLASRLDPDNPRTVTLVGLSDDTSFQVSGKMFKVVAQDGSTSIQVKQRA